MPRYLCSTLYTCVCWPCSYAGVSAPLHINIYIYIYMLQAPKHKLCHKQNKIKLFLTEGKRVTLKFLGTKTQCTLRWPYAEVDWLYCEYFIWCISCIVVVLICFVICGVRVCMGFVMCGCFGKMCTRIYCVFVWFRPCIRILFMLLFDFINYMFLFSCLCIFYCYVMFCYVYSVFIVPTGTLRLPWLGFLRVFFLSCKANARV